MKQLHNLDITETIKCQEIHNKENILQILDNLVNIIKNPESLNEALNKTAATERIFYNAYTSICMILGESRELLNNHTDWDEISYHYMNLLKASLQQNIYYIPPSLFSGLSGIAFGAYSLYKSTSYYKKFIDSLNRIIIDHTSHIINKAKSEISNVKMSTYDTMSGLSGIAGYLLLFKEEPAIKECIIQILEYFILLPKERKVFDKGVPSWHISAENQFLENEKKIYSKGNFNLGLSHGITGPLVILATALKEGIEIDGQTDAINRILFDLKRFANTDDDRAVFWPGRIPFEDYIEGKRKLEKSRASWCYGTPGIARALYIAGTAINDQDSINLAIKAIDELSTMTETDWLLESPTICHGYAGLLDVIYAMYVDTGDHKYYQCCIRLSDIIISYFDPNSLFGFYDINKSMESGYKEIEKNNDISFLSGASGVILSLLLLIKPIKTNWLRHLLIL